MLLLIIKDTRAGLLTINKHCSKYKIRIFAILYSCVRLRVQHVRVPLMGKEDLQLVVKYACDWTTFMVL